MDAQLLPPAPAGPSHPPAKKPRRRLRTLCRAVAILATGLLVAAAGTVALDQVRLDRGGEEPAAEAPTFAEFLQGVPSEFMLNGPIPAGTAAPDFALPDVHDGRTVRLSDFRGRPLVLVFG